MKQFAYKSPEGDLGKKHDFGGENKISALATGFCSKVYLPLRMPRSRLKSRFETKFVGRDNACDLTDSWEQGLVKQKGVRRAARLHHTLEKALGFTILEWKLGVP